MQVNEKFEYYRNGEEALKQDSTKVLHSILRPTFEKKHNIFIMTPAPISQYAIKLIS